MDVAEENAEIGAVANVRRGGRAGRGHGVDWFAIDVDERCIAHRARPLRESDDLRLLVEGRERAGTANERVTLEPARVIQSVTAFGRPVNLQQARAGPAWSCVRRVK